MFKISGKLGTLILNEQYQQPRKRRKKRSMRSNSQEPLRQPGLDDDDEPVLNRQHDFDDDEEDLDIDDFDYADEVEDYGRGMHNHRQEPLEHPE